MNSCDEELEVIEKVSSVEELVTVDCHDIGFDCDGNPVSAASTMFSIIPIADTYKYYYFDTVIKAPDWLLYATNPTSDYFHAFDYGSVGTGTFYLFCAPNESNKPRTATVTITVDISNELGYYTADDGPIHYIMQKSFTVTQAGSAGGL